MFASSRYAAVRMRRRYQAVGFGGGGAAIFLSTCVLVLSTGREAIWWTWPGRRRSFLALVDYGDRPMPVLRPGVRLRITPA